MVPVIGRVEPYWQDRPVILCATGPSLKHFDFERLRGLGRILAVKQAWKDLPFAEACFGLDIPWMRWAHEDLLDVAKRMTLYLGVPPKCDVKGVREVPGAIYLNRERAAEKLIIAHDTIESAGNSGFGAFNLAVNKIVLGPSPARPPIFLFGFDYIGDQHYRPTDYVSMPAGHRAKYQASWASNFRCTKAQVEALGLTVFNASPTSNIDAFPKVTHAQALEHLDRLRQQAT